ncbi:MAG TPA: hypothetical protein VKV24_13295 [Casimicrobiaceae bacterium]|nr:hypothetical protein [Casimicrobiaceae bacterium]
MPNVGESIARTTRAYNAALERLIVRHPEQWWWLHRRFRRARGKASKRARPAIAGSD